MQVPPSATHPCKAMVVKNTAGGACSGTWELTYQSRLVRRGGLKYTGAKPEHFSQRVNRGAAAVDSEKTLLCSWALIRSVVCALLFVFKAVEGSSFLEETFPNMLYVCFIMWFNLPAEEMRFCYPAGLHNTWSGIINHKNMWHHPHHQPHDTVYWLCWLFYFPNNYFSKSADHLELSTTFKH